MNSSHRYTKSDTGIVGGLKRMGSLFPTLSGTSKLLSLTGTEYKKTMDDYVRKYMSEFKKAEKISITYCDIPHFLTGFSTIFEKTLYLSLEGNALSYLEHKSIFPVLIELNLSINKFTKFPSHLSSTFKSLQILNLRKNQLTSISYKQTDGMINLETLDLSQNKFTEFPIAILQCQNLKCLRIVRNKIKHIPVKVYQDFVNLQELIVSGNPIVRLNPEIKNLKTLETLGISHTDITELPSSIATMRKLKNIYVENVPLKIPKLVWAERGIKAIRKFFGVEQLMSGDEDDEEDESSSSSSSEGLFEGKKLRSSGSSSGHSEELSVNQSRGSVSKDSINLHSMSKSGVSGKQEETKSKKQVGDLLGLFAPRSKSTKQGFAIGKKHTAKGKILFGKGNGESFSETFLPQVEKSFDQSYSRSFGQAINKGNINIEIQKLENHKFGDKIMASYDMHVGKAKLTYAEAYKEFRPGLNAILVEDKFIKILEEIQYNDFDFYRHISTMLNSIDKYMLKLKLSYIKSYLEEFFDEIAINLKCCKKGLHLRDITPEEVNTARIPNYDINTLETQFIIKIGNNHELIDILEYCGFYLVRKMKQIPYYTIEKNSHNYEHCKKIVSFIKDIIDSPLDFE